MKKILKVLLFSFLLAFSLFCFFTYNSDKASENHSFSISELADKVKSVFVGDKTEEKYARVEEDLKKFRSQLIAYMEDNCSACSNGSINAESINRYLDHDNLMVVVDPECLTGNSKMTDPWWHNYVMEIVNNRDGGNTVGLGTDKAFIYVYCGGKDKLYGEKDENKDDCVLVVQYSDGSVYSRIFMPTDLEIQGNDCRENHYDGSYHNTATAVKQADNATRHTQKKSGSRFYSTVTAAKQEGNSTSHACGKSGSRFRS